MLLVSGNQVSTMRTIMNKDASPMAGFRREATTEADEASRAASSYRSPVVVAAWDACAPPK